jgi:hypothetical protein
MCVCMMAIEPCDCAAILLAPLSHAHFLDNMHEAGLRGSAVCVLHDNLCHPLPTQRSCRSQLHLQGLKSRQDAIASRCFLLS